MFSKLQCSDSNNNMGMCSVGYSVHIGSDNNMGILFSWLQCIDSDNNMGICSVGYSVVTLITIWEYVQLVKVALITIWTVFSWLQ